MPIPELSTKHRNNLQKLATYLKALPEGYEHFHMGTYFQDRGDEYSGQCPSELETQSYTRCGTIACAAGHGPAAGVIATIDGCSWDEYILEEFGVEWRCNSGDANWSYLFAWNWELFDNTPQGAGERIEYFLANGVPEGFIQDGFEMEGLLDYLK